MRTIVALAHRGIVRYSYIINGYGAMPMDKNEQNLHASDNLRRLFNAINRLKESQRKWSEYKYRCYMQQQLANGLTLPDVCDATDTLPVFLRKQAC